MREVFHQLFYHVVWATKNREPQLLPALRPPLFEVIQEKARRLDCRIHAVNAVEDHVHLVLEIPPSRAVALVVGQLKGVSAHAINQICPGAIHWQDGYGVITFRLAELSKVVRYVATQEARHHAHALSPLLETWTTSAEEGGPGCDGP